MRKNENSIERLLAEARSGSRAGMENLAIAVRQRLYPFILRTTWDRDLTEDILQETLLTMVRQVRSLRDTARFWGWVHQVAWSKIQDNVRSARLHSVARATLLARRPSEGHGSDSVLDTSIQTETRERLSSLLERLSRPHRDIIQLRCYEQLPYAEIASLRRTTPQKARACFHRATEALKAQMV